MTAMTALLQAVGMPNTSHRVSQDAGECLVLLLPALAAELGPACPLLADLFT